MRSSALISSIALAFVASPAHADTICEWMDYASTIANAAAPPPAGAPQNPGHEHVGTQVALAMFEATNAIDHRYETYLGLPKGDAKASEDAAAVTAAYQVLLSHFPEQKTGLDDSYHIAMNEVRDPKAREAGRLIGEAAAKLALAAGGIDPAIKQEQYRPRTAPGVYIATALPVIQPFSTAFKPWVITSVEAMRPPPPPALTSERWARDFNEVKALGGKASTTRTDQQSLMARYRITPNMMPSLRLVADAKGRSEVQNARMFALFGMATDDAYMATLAAKIYYNFWRPVTAIRNADTDGNAATDIDPAWLPLINTPNHPEYPCGHCTFAGAAAEIMKAETGASPPGGVRVSSSSIPNSAVQVLPTWDDWVREVSFSRTLGGVHYRFSNEAGEKIGSDVAKMTLAKVMRPLKR
jgi:PAP2 superfamily